MAISGQQPLDRNPAAVYLGSLSPRSRETMLQALNVIAVILGADRAYQEIRNKRGSAAQKDMTCFFFDWPGLGYQHTAAVQVQLRDRYQAATVNKMLCALRGTLKAAWRLGLMQADDYQAARDVQSISGETIPAGRGLSSGELSGLLEACAKDETAAGCRDGAIVAMMYAAGLRRAEIPGLDLADYDPQTGCLVILGKRNKKRTAYLIGGAAAAMDDWIALRGPWAGPLFWPINKAGRVESRRITSQAIYNLLQKRGEEAGLIHFTPHDMRRTCISDLLEAGADIATVAKLAGHASVTTTARYDRRTEQAKIKTAGLLHVPYHKRTK
jgi:site-specific recombinase XerD